LRGDVLVSQGHADLARNAYESALKTLPKDSEEQKNTLEMKLNNLADATVSNSSVQSNSTSETPNP